MNKTAPTLGQTTIWGCRGSLPLSGPESVEFGGATSCVGQHLGDSYLLCDAGSGIAEAGEMALRQGIRSFDIVLSHWHFDHVMGLPFFQPLWRSDCVVRLWTGNLHPMTGREALAKLMAPPFFPVTDRHFKCQFDVIDFLPGDTLNIGGVQVSTLNMTHPQGAVGFRIRSAFGDWAYLTDVEPDDAMTARLVEFVRGADSFVYDCTFDDADHLEGHGHSTWQACLALGEAAGVAQPVVFHHHPRATDNELKRLESRVQARMPTARVARDGDVLALASSNALRGHA